MSDETFPGGGYDTPKRHILVDGEYVEINRTNNMLGYMAMFTEESEEENLIQTSFNASGLADVIREYFAAGTPLAQQAYEVLHRYQQLSVAVRKDPNSAEPTEAFRVWQQDYYDDPKFWVMLSDVYDEIRPKLIEAGFKPADICD